MEPLFPVCVVNLICVVIIVAGEQCAEETRSCDSKDECFHFIGKVSCESVMFIARANQVLLSFWIII